MIINFNTVVLDKDYSKLDIPMKRMVPILQYGLEPGYYGGNVTHIGEIKDSKLLLLINNNKSMAVIDTGVLQEDYNEFLETLKVEALKEIASHRNIPKFNPKKIISKESLIDLLKLA